jgi:Got1/Sft2-like family
LDCIRGSAGATMALEDNKKIGTGLLILGFVFLFLGVLLFFDANLLAVGDVLFLLGITMTIGAKRTFVFFFKRKQLRGNVFFFGGILLVLCRWAFVGMMLQVR